MSAQPLTAKNILRKIGLLASEVSVLSGITSTTNELDEFVIGQANISDISGTNGVTFTSPYAGELVLAISRVSGDPGAETDLAVVVDGGTSAGDIVIANGASADEVDTLTVTTNNTLSVGSKITVTSDGAASSAVNADVVLVGRRV